MTLTRLAMPSPCYSSRNPAGVRLIVVHTAEGARSIESLGSFFANPANGVSSHAGADDKTNTIGVYVKRPDTAWTQAGANGVAVSIELCAFAAWDSATWNTHEAMLANCAAWIAEEAAAFGIPIMKLTSAQAQGGGLGVCAHSDLGSWGGGHSDPGPAFPWAHVIDLAAGGGPQPEPEPEEPEMVLIVNSRGEVSSFDGTRRTKIANMTAVNNLRAAGVELVDFDDASYNAIPLA